MELVALSQISSRMPSRHWVARGILSGLRIPSASMSHRAVLLCSTFETLFVDVGEVLNQGHLKAPPDQEAPQHIPVDVAAGMAQVTEVVDRPPQQ